MRQQSVPQDARDQEPSPTDGERLQKLIARAGVASRRAAEELITQGRVTVNGHVIKELGAKADPLSDRIIVDGKPLHFPTGPATVILLHKPKGVVTTKKDPEGRPTVLQYLPEKYQHLHPVGRLDYDTSGVLLLTDDGELTQLLTHPSHGVEKVYWARVRGHLSSETLKRLATGIYLEDGKTAPCKVRVRAQTENNSLVEMTLHEGRTRQVRRMLEAVGHPVRALRRISFGGVVLEGMLTGDYRVLLPGEVHQLRKAAEKKKPSVQKKRPQRPKPTRTNIQEENSKPKANKSKEAKLSRSSQAPRPSATKPLGKPTAFKSSATKPYVKPQKPQPGERPKAGSKSTTGPSRPPQQNATAGHSAAPRAPQQRAPQQRAPQQRAAQPRASQPRTSQQRAGQSRPAAQHPSRQSSQGRSQNPLARRIERQWDSDGS
ncbi:MAG: pseudouridine synthase [Abitibacteriaceae bacterium]|nr:pseudouridine synthase [Abditibacteriaceae bacterium]MBV9864509.1 pseudouridine synthase [Abditibacteriaceae bacterium]